MKETYNFYMLQSAMLCGPHGRGEPGPANTVAAGYPYPDKLLPEEAGRGQPPPGGRIVIRGREPCVGREQTCLPAGRGQKEKSRLPGNVVGMIRCGRKVPGEEYVKKIACREAGER